MRVSETELLLPVSIVDVVVVVVAVVIVVVAGVVDVVGVVVGVVAGAAVVEPHSSVLAGQAPALFGKQSELEAWHGPEEGGVQLTHAVGGRVMAGVVTVSMQLI